tara:strand:- start:285 stop:1802 length:1518 start_codon:yes stop_codon:yes gene_type:complete
MVSKVILLVSVSAVLVMGFLLLPSEPSNTIVFEIPDTNESKIIVGDVELIVSNDNIVAVSIIDDVFDKPPDIIIPISSELPLSLLNEVQYSFEEDVIDAEIVVNKYELTTKITYNDGSESSQSSFVDLQSLDFLTLDDVAKEFDNGKLSFKLSVPINKQIRLAQSEFTLNYIEPNNTVKEMKYIFNTKTQSDVKDEMIVFLDEDIEFASILTSLPLGTNELVLTLDKLFIIYDDNSREYASPDTILYSVTIEKSDSKYIITNETGNTTKIWDSDIPLTISTNTQSVTAETCVTSSSTGCTQSFQSFYKVVSPKLGHITITNLDNNNELVRTDVVSESSCINNIVDSEINLCESVGDGTKFTFMLQRDTSYKIEVGSPQNESFVINTPETDDSYNFTTLIATTQTALPQKQMTQAYCSSQTGAGYNGVTYQAKSPTASDSYYHAERTVYVNNLGKVQNSHLVMEDGGICTQKYNTSNGQAWYNYGYRTLTVPTEYVYAEKLVSNFQ